MRWRLGSGQRAAGTAHGHHKPLSSRECTAYQHLPGSILSITITEFVIRDCATFVFATAQLAHIQCQLSVESNTHRKAQRELLQMLQHA